MGRRRAEIRAYLASIDERVVEGATVRGAACEFYLPDRDVAVTLDAGTYHRLRITDTYVVFCEHEMRGRDLGARLPFDTPAQRARNRIRTGAGTGHRATFQGSGAWRRTTRGANARAAAGHQHREEVVAAAYRTLGLTRTASASEVKAAYREKVKDVHPDRGGSEAAYTRVQVAYATAKADAS